MIETIKGIVFPPDLWIELLLEPFTRMLKRHLRWVSVSVKWHREYDIKYVQKNIIWSIKEYNVVYLRFLD